jgi:hypothetical protein
MSVTDVEVSRALNALVATLNDQRPSTSDGQRWQSIVSGALGGEQTIVVHVETGNLLDAEGNVLAHVRRQDDRWIGERVGSPLSGGYIPR